MEEIANETSRQHSERESAWHELLANNCLENISTDEEQLRLARRARCFYVEEYILEKLQRYETMLECYLNNALRHESVFSYIERYARHPERQILPQIKKHFKHLLQIDTKETTRLIAEYFINEIRNFLAIIEDDKALSYGFLQSLHERSVPLTSTQSELLLELLLVEKPEFVTDFLQSTDTYRIDRALKLVNSHKQYNAAIYLYEKQGNYREAFNLSMQLLADADETNAEVCAQQISALCARASAFLSAKEREEYWFTLLKMILPRDDFKSITKLMLHEASQYVDLPSLVQLVMNTHNVSGSFGDIKDLLMSMLSSSHYETDAMAIAARILGNDLHLLFEKKRQEACTGLWVTSVRCVQCHNRLYNQTNVLVFSSCGHAMHERCAQEYEISVREASGVVCDSKTYTSEDVDDADNLSNVFKCPRCHVEFTENELNTPIYLSQPCVRVKPQQNQYNMMSDIKELGVLNLKAPPRRF